VILVDAVPRGQRPGTVYVLEPEPDDVDADDAVDDLVEPHNLDPVKVLRLVRRMGGCLDRLLLVGCEPVPLDADDMQLGLSVAVAAAVDDAVLMVQELIDEIFMTTGV